MLDLKQPLPFYRTPNPQLTYILLLVGLWFLYQIWSKPTLIKTFLTATIGTLLFLTYFYHATFFALISLILLSLSLLQRRFVPAMSLLVITVTLALVTGVFLYISKLPQNQTLNITGGVFSARYVDWVFTIRYGATLVILWWFGKRIERTQLIYLSALLIAAICVMNFQLFTGWTIQPGHWPQTTLEPTVFLILALVFFRYWKRLISIKISLLFIGLLLIYGVAYQVRFLNQNPQVWSLPYDATKIIEWLNIHRTSSTVVTSLNVDLLNYLPTLSNVNIFVPVEQYHYASMDEIWERVIYNYQLYGFKELPLEKNSLPLGIYFEQVYNVNRYKHFLLSEYEPDIRNQINSCYPSLCTTIYSLPNSVILNVNLRFNQLLGKPNPYRLTYALYTPYENNLSAKPPSDKIVFRSGEYYVYAIDDSFASSNNE